MHALEKRNLLPEDLQPVKNIKEYKALGGLEGLKKARAMAPADVIAEIKKANLRGRGGAGFPMAIKWGGVAAAPDAKKYIVCNMAEGEPGTYKDRYLLSKNPYLVFEGMLIAAHAIGATEAILGTKQKFTATIPQLQRALKELEQEGVVEKGFMRIALGPDDYLLGEEKGILEMIDGRQPMPRFFPPYMVGVGANATETNPTVVNNCESLSHVPKIMANGADWFLAMGTEDTPGTVIFSLSGDVKNPGMYEVETGLTVRQLLYDIGGGPRADKEFKAVFSGVANRVLTPDQFDLVIDFGTMRNAGVGLGSAGFIVYDEGRSMVEVAWMFSKFLAVSSCGQCIPCNTGTREIMEHLDNLRCGRGAPADLEALTDIAGRCMTQTRCFLPTQASVLVGSVMEKFSEEFSYYAHNADTCISDDLIIPKIQSYDEKEGRFIMESDPKEFRPEFDTLY
ncbi:MAG: NADH-quinone oxidoreductase subunit F [Lysobacterales bacterium]|jgi:NADH-quinone oxidoreductase subunit F